ncbi:Acyl-CoA synthetase (AMP-forming)/AMP-acid ligase II [Thermomonospora echinospora]|uniref:Acyl-CoA synthetase (AMP-forming)/AMP-acid ligase II n=1 Tax=Thermomonospora echinospora TaxID=1992 RepID=A0A1H6DPY8_9ACTN|nr:long-chain-fatty-acid--CoA ligase [Thermomonospora echinospora]SEG86625.1 Acyl-CoA synthetase (AMP-forming)/AMP-acid ligase II [Thermomonospora echinospora]
MLINDIIEFAARKHPGRTALRFEEQVITFAGMRDRIRRVANALRTVAEPGDRVAVLSGNRPEYVDLYYGVPAAGMALTFLNHRLHPSEIAALVNHAQASVLIVSGEHLGAMSEHRAAMPTVKTVIALDGGGDADYTELVSAASTAEPPRVDEDSVAWLVYTSGTTGRPKGVMLSHKNLLTGVISSVAHWNVPDDQVFLFCFPLCHVGGYVVLVNHLRSCTVGILRAYDNATFLRLVAEWKVTNTGLAPTMIAFLLRHPGIEDEDLGTLRAIGYGASAIPAEVLRRGMEVLGCDFYQGMGMSELGGNILHFGEAEHRRAAAGETHLLAAAGRPMDLASIRIVDPDFNDVPPGEPGEMLVRGDQVMLGYWREPELTEASFRNGWFRTGDVVRQDAEGMVYIVDRLKDMIITGGENVASREVEEILYRHPAVQDVAVFGVPDPQWGESVCAAVVLREGSAEDPDSIIAFAREHLGGYKVPRRIEFIRELPRNIAGKVLKRDLRAVHIAKDQT